MCYEQIRQATLAGARAAIAKGETSSQIRALAAKMRTDAMSFNSYNDDPTVAWQAFILKTADEVEALAGEAS